MTSAPPHLDLVGRRVGRRRLRRLSRRFAAVGVEVSADRLSELAAGSPATEEELFDVAFAQTAARFRGDQRRAGRRRVRRRCVHSVIVLLAVVLALTAVLCLGLGFFLMALHQSPV